MVIQNNLLNLNTNRQAVTMEKPENAPKEKPVAEPKEERNEEEAVSVTLTDASRRLNQARPDSLERKLPDDGSRVGEDEAARIMDDTRANMMQAPGQTVMAQANQDPAKVTSLLQ